ncbi:MAG: hypothetical protein GY938_05445 [Ketobacter sp.]|nr:hypothetical protein [Ketobacter sp.]
MGFSDIAGDYRLYAIVAADAGGIALMDDKTLADAIVGLGVGSERGGYYSHIGSGFLSETQNAPPWFVRTNQTPDTFVRDWRVAGALMELCAKSNDPDKRTIALSFGPEMFCATAAGSSTPTYGVYLERSNKSAPRAICEACVKALT